MRSPTAALLWEIWHRHRAPAGVIAAATVAGIVLHYAERPTDDPSALVTLLSMIAFLFLFAIFGGQFPRRLFTMPVSSLRLATIPVLTGIVAVELLYLLWLDPLSRGGSTSVLFVAVLLAALMVFFQTVMWTLERIGPLKLIVAGSVAIVVYVIGLLPSWPPSPPPWWRSETTLTAVMATLGVVAFVVAVRHIARQRFGGGRSVYRLETLVAAVSEVVPRGRIPFRSPAAAQFWFEWRTSGLMLPMLVGGVLIVFVAPLSWFARDDAGNSLRLLLATLAAPIFQAIPVGMALAKPGFWSEDLSLPPFVAIRPLIDEEIVAIKLKVAAASTAVSWLLVLFFVGAWLSLWANLDAVSQLAIQWWAFHERSIVAVYGTTVLILIAGMILTWRCMVSRLWTGLSGNRMLFTTSVLSVVVAIILALVFDATRLPGWALDDPARMAAIVWILAIAVIAKCWLAAYSWRGVSARYVRDYLLIWTGTTTCLVILALVLWQVVRHYVALDIYRFQGLMILLALLAVPLGRIGAAASCLTRNRHR